MAVPGRPLQHRVHGGEYAGLPDVGHQLLNVAPADGPFAAIERQLLKLQVDDPEIVPYSIRQSSGRIVVYGGAVATRPLLHPLTEGPGPRHGKGLHLDQPLDLLQYRVGRPQGAVHKDEVRGGRHLGQQVGQLVPGLQLGRARSGGAPAGPRPRLEHRQQPAHDNHPLVGHEGHSEAGRRQLSVPDVPPLQHHDVHVPELRRLDALLHRLQDFSPGEFVIAKQQMYQAPRFPRIR